MSVRTVKRKVCIPCALFWLGVLIVGGFFVALMIAGEFTVRAGRRFDDAWIAGREALAAVFTPRQAEDAILEAEEREETA